MIFFFVPVLSQCCPNKLTGGISFHRLFCKALFSAGVTVYTCLVEFLVKSSGPGVFFVWRCLNHTLYFFNNCRVIHIICFSLSGLLLLFSSRNLLYISCKFIGIKLAPGASGMWCFRSFPVVTVLSFVSFAGTYPSFFRNTGLLGSSVLRIHFLFSVLLVSAYHYFLPAFSLSPNEVEVMSLSETTLIQTYTSNIKCLSLSNIFVPAQTFLQAVLSFLFNLKCISILYGFLFGPQDI